MVAVSDVFTLEECSSEITAHKKFYQIKVNHISVNHSNKLQSTICVFGEHYLVGFKIIEKPKGHKIAVIII